jgi:prepilin-type N-terminal cleavage/methylation domain-containing protein/prepilin-type processing-associated H-X9-DG protein
MSSKRRAAFTLIEMLVVLAIAAVLIGLAASAVQRVREVANRASCANHLRQIGLALHQYHESQGVLPPGCSYQDGRAPQLHMSWLTRLLPHLEQDALWKQALQAYAKDPFFETPPHLPILGHVLPIFTCPSDSRTLSPWDFGPFQVAFTAYLGVSGWDRSSLDGLFYVDSSVRLADITDGLSNTLAVGERPPSADHRFGWWYAGWGQARDGSAEYLLGVRERNFATGYEACPDGPYEYAPGRPNYPCDVFHFWSLHFGAGANFLYADGSVHFVAYSAAPLMPALATRSGGEAVTPPE